MRMKMPSPEMREYIKKTFHYDPNTGILSRRLKSGKLKKVGAKHSLGYQVITFYLSGEIYRSLVHRVAWFLHYGYWTTYEIDHINSDRKNNKITNLREATHQQNRQNSIKRSLKPNASGRPKSKYKGVKMDKAGARKPWQAIICNKYLGHFATEEDAAKAYNEAAIKLFGKFARLNLLVATSDEEMRKVIGDEISNRWHEHESEEDK